MTLTLERVSESTSFGPTLPTHDQVVCTLFEKDFHYGLAALANSLVQCGFRGLIWAGYRGALPAWTKALPKLSNGLFDLGGATLGFEEIATGKHFTQYKPEFLGTLFGRGIATKYVWYFDPDITARCSWNFFVQWAQYGVALCQDITPGTMPARHPLRCGWMEVARAAGWVGPLREQECYYNAGFIGLDKKFESFLRIWLNALELTYSTGAGPEVFRQSKREQIFYFPDQDALNMAAMYADVPLSTIGPEGMGFLNGGFTMYHSAGRTKTWRKKFLLNSVRGVPPSNADKHYLQCVDGPIRPYTRTQLRNLRLRAGIATAIGRFYRRSGQP